MLVSLKVSLWWVVHYGGSLCVAFFSLYHYFRTVLQFIPCLYFCYRHSILLCAFSYVCNNRWNRLEKTMTKSSRGDDSKEWSQHRNCTRFKEISQWLFMYTLVCVLFISTKFVKRCLAIIFLLLLISSWNLHDMCQHFLCSKKRNFSLIR